MIHFLLFDETKFFNVRKRKDKKEVKTCLYNKSPSNLQKKTKL